MRLFGTQNTKALTKRSRKLSQVFLATPFGHALQVLAVAYDDLRLL